MEQAQIQPTPDGAIVFDASAIVQALFDPAWFEPDYWAAREATPGGRGGAVFIEAPFGHCALRHYRRGGMMAHLLGDRYVWAGAERTRGFVEFRLLQALRGKGLPAPQPLAARYRRSGAHYRADIITRRIDHAETMAECLGQDRLDSSLAVRVGSAIAAFHAQGAYHADLNAHNVLVADEDIWLIDFDRGQLRPPARAWQLANLARLKRSLVKLGASSHGDASFENNLWQPLLTAYDKVMAS